MSNNHDAFWDDLAEDLKDPDFLRDYIVESMRIATIDRIVNELDAARSAAGLSKAALARAISSEPAVVRRLFSAGHVNPTLGTLAEVATALGMRITLEPLPAGEQRTVTTPLLTGEAADRPALTEHLRKLRTQGKTPAAA
ncbi:helix-turn-helix domain-containing protein [Streptomyces sp. gb1(2016)]|uniref:XRE family transcriptional regulator n=1 Tax=Streptomyces sp. gb1(2016) TaxID=1828321 RepID=A0A652LA60_9ACTN|nr:helix-turn-helix domain-containing protein [Streptomyces sp. gb1(2016)]TXS32790.1 XRE family transcriptional regulator [Streptomyces sp. gb1(2016)]